MPKVLQKIWHSPRVFELRLERGGLSFAPGECVLLVDADQCTSRPYSISSSPDDPYLGFIIRHLKGGVLTDYLSSREVGDEVSVGPPFGWFFPAKAGPSVFIATGTGISPFLSYLKQAAYGPPLALLYGVRQRQDAIEVDFLRQRSPLTLVVSGEVCPDAKQGRVTDYLDDLPVGRLGEADIPVAFYLCGQGSMIKEVTAWLKARKVPASRIFTEVFF